MKDRGKLWRPPAWAILSLALGIGFSFAINAGLEARERGLLRGLLGGGQRNGPEANDRGPASASGLQRVTINVRGDEREYLLSVPTSYRPGVAIPLVIVLHGGGDNVDHMARFTHFPMVGEEQGFIVAIPQGSGNTWNAGSGRGDGVAERRNVDDIGFIQAMLAQIKGSHSIDPKRVYAAGMSKGGMFAYYVACSMSDQIAAIAAISATQTAARCNPSSPVAILHIQGSADENVPLNGGHGTYSARGAVYPAVQQGIDLWRAKNSCSANVNETRLTSDTTCKAYRGCDQEITLCVVQNGGHAWPGQVKERWQERADYYVTQSFDATSMAWQFFKQHPKN